MRAPGILPPPRQRLRAGLIAAGAAGCLLAGLLTLLAGAGFGRAQGLRYVDDDLGCEGQRPCYQSIQAAVDAAEAGDLISVAAGRYTETVVLVDRTVQFQGPGLADPDGRGQPDREALWAGLDNGLPGPALTVDARSGDLADLSLRGFRFVGGSVGVLLLGRRVGDPLPPPAGLPPSAADTALVGARIEANTFEGLQGAWPEGAAVLAYWASDLRVSGNRMRGGGGGLHLVGGTGLDLRDNTIEGPAGDGIRLAGPGSAWMVERNSVIEAGGRGIAVTDLAELGEASRLRDVRLTDNSVLATGAEGIALRLDHGGTIEQVALRLNRVIGALAAGGAGEGGILLRAASGRLDGTRVEGGTIQGTGRPAVGAGAGLVAHGLTGDLDLVDLSILDGAGAGIRLTDVTRAWLHRSTLTGNLEGLRIVETAAIPPGAPSELTIGGFAGEGNQLGGNAGPALALENARGDAAATLDVNASYNDWGTAYAPIIEDRVWHRPDAPAQGPALGIVGYLPALGVPQALALRAEPAQLVADGLSNGIISAGLSDAAGRPAAADSLVRWATDAGSIERPGLAAEAEGGADAPERQGEWGLFDSSTFGPFSGGGYLRSEQAGAQLEWRFDAEALVIRYGQTVLDAGRLAVEVDGRDLGSFSTRGPRRAWVQRLVASGLGPGPHRVRLRIVSGEVNIDQLQAGQTAPGGTAATRLRAGTAIGVAQVTALAQGGESPVAGRLDVPFTAGPPARLRLDAARTTLAVGGETSAMTARVEDAFGRPVPDRTEVRFNAAGGGVAPERALTQAGRAAAVFSSGSVLGPARVSASAGAISVTRALTLTAGPPAEVRVQPGQARLPANSVASTELAIAVRDAFGHPVPDGTAVRLTTNLGRVEPALTATTAGTARSRLFAGALAGEARVAAQAGAAQGEAAVALDGLDLKLVKSAEPQTVVVPGEPVTFSLRFSNEASGSVYDLELHDPLPTGLISPSYRLAFNPPGPEVEVLPGAPYAFRVDQLRPGQSGLLTISARVDTSLRWGPRNTLTNRATAGSPKAAERTPEDNQSSADLTIVPGAVVTVTLRAPERLPVGGASGRLTARVTDRFGNPVADGTSVFFTSDLGSVNPQVGQTRNGTVDSSFITGSRAGTATLRAISTGDRGAAARVEVLPGPPASLDLASAAARLRVGGETTVITASLRDGYGNGVPDQLVSLETDMGLLSVTAARTDATGRVTSTLRSGVRLGVASLRARSGALADTRVIPFDPGPVASLDLLLDPPVLALGARGLVLGLVADEFGNPVPGVPVEFDSEIAVLQRRSVTSGPDGRAANPMSGLRAGMGLVRASAAGYATSALLTVRPARVYLPLALKH